MGWPTRSTPTVRLRRSCRAASCGSPRSTNCASTSKNTPEQCRSLFSRGADGSRRARLRGVGQRNLDGKRVSERDLFKAIEAPGCTHVARTHVGMQCEQRPANAACAQARDPFRRLPVSHARIGEAGKHEHRRIVLRTYILIRIIAENGAEDVGVGAWIAPLQPF